MQIYCISTVFLCNRHVALVFGKLFDLLLGLLVFAFFAHVLLEGHGVHIYLYKMLEYIIKALIIEWLVVVCYIEKPLCLKREGFFMIIDK